MAFSTPKVLRTLRNAGPTLEYQGFFQRCRCAYHSYEHEDPPPFPAVETAILSAALAHVPTHGFTTTALCHGARDANYRDVSISLFPAGAFALVNYHLVTQRLALAKGRPSPDQPASVGAEVRRLIWKRLYANVPIIHRWQEVGYFISEIPKSFLYSVNRPIFMLHFLLFDPLLASFRPSPYLLTAKHPGPCPYSSPRASSGIPSRALPSLR